MRLVAVLMAAGVVAGCGPMPRPVLVADGETYESRRSDVTACRFEGVRASAGIYHPNVFIQASDRRSAEDRVFRACMFARGYREQQRVLTFAEWDAIQNEGR